MNNILKHLLLCLFCLTATTAMAQRRISGTVSDDFDVIPGANVVELDKNNRIVSQAVTDMNGNFTLQVKSDKDFLRVTFIGLKEFKEVIGNRTVFKIHLKENTKQLQEVVKTAKRKTVSGGMSIPQREMTGASQTFSMEEMEGLAFESVDQALQGQIAGLDIVANSGNLGAGTTMRLRGTATINGNAQPLIVVDDQIFELPDQEINFEEYDNEEMFSTLLNVNTDDIESINVLKDAASAAKWGVRGSAGVIEIKLKRGRRGPTRVNFSYKFTGTWQPDGYKMLDGDGYTMMLKESYFNPNRVAKDFLELDYRDEYPDIYHNFNKNTDWIDAVKQFGAQHQYSLNISGGGEKATFRVSGGYDSSTGSVIGQKLDRITTTTRLDYNVSDRITFHGNVTMSFTTNWKNNSNNILARAYKAMPNMSIYEYDRSGNLTGNYFNMLAPYGITGTTTDSRLRDMFDNGNPVARANLAWDKEYQYSLVPNFSIDYKLLGLDDESTQLTYRGTVQLNVWNTSSDKYEPTELRTLAWYYHYPGGNYNGNNWGMPNTRNTLGNSEYKSLEFRTRHELEFTPKFANDKHFLNALFRFDLNTNTGTSQGITLWNAPTGITDPTVSALMTDTYVSNSEGRSQSFYLTAHYSYDSKYILRAGVNVSGSTAFGKGKKYGYFPSVSLRWNISDEKFMNWMKPVVNMLAVSPNWGMTGLTVGGGDSQYNKYSAGGNYLGHNTIHPENLSLTNIKWETSTQLDLRVNLGLWDDLITVDFDYYDKKIKDLVHDNNRMRIPSSNGFSNLWAVNSGKMRNRGWELYMNTGKICKVGKFSMKLKANFAQNINEVEEMDALLLSAYNGNKNLSLSNNGYDAMKRVQVGNALGSIYGLKFKGVYTYDYAHSGMTNESQHNYGETTASGYTESGAIINTYAAALNRGENVTCPIAYDAQGNVITDKYGEPLQMYFQYQDGTKYKFEGGDAIYEDINHDGQIDRYDVVYLGNSNPTFNGGFGASFFFGRLSLNASFLYRVGNQIVNSARSELEGMVDNNNQSFATTWRWRKNGDETTIPRAMNSNAGRSFNSLPSDRYVEDGDFLRFNYLQLSYDFDTNLVKKWGLSSLKLSASANNLCVWTKYTGIDPEVSPGGFGIANDHNKTPRARSFTVNLNVGF